MRASDLKEAPDIAVKNEGVPSHYASNWRSSALRRIEGSSLVAHLCEDSQASMAPVGPQGTLRWPKISSPQIGVKLVQDICLVS